MFRRIAKSLLIALGGGILIIAVLAVWLWPRSPFLPPVKPQFSMIRSADNPLITASMSPRLTALSQQQGFTNINGPTVIRVPDWVTEPLGQYYMYFAHHKGDFIRMAYADHVEGPWRIYEPGALALEDSGFPVDSVPELSAEDGLKELWVNFPIFVVRDSIRAMYQALVTDQAERQRRGIAATKYKTPHIASPDVVLDVEQRRLVMFYHGQRDSLAQVTRVAVSQDGINFTVEGKTIPASYVRSFEYRGKYYLIGALGMLLRSDQLLGDYSIREKSLFGPSMRHLSVDVDESNDEMHVFWSRVGDAPERILYSLVNLGADWNDWQASRGVTVLQPEFPWEGSKQPLQSSLRGEMVQITNELRDPYLFTDVDGQKYLFYVGSGEQAIGVARAISPGNDKIIQ
ncbi:MAG: hypothetical protein KJP04_04085 [Arenicella sp.]|nr:hypothetical protein [Arenicella sp.]